MSKPKNVTIGVPQGSILGPLFFILFVNDYPDCLEYSHATIYADDTSQDVCDKSVDVIVEKLTADLFNSLKWMERNKLTMNLKKTQYMLKSFLVVYLPVPFYQRVPIPSYRC